MRKLNVPAALFVGLVTSFVGVFAVTAADIVAMGDDHGFDILRWLGFEYGTTVASAVVVAFALFGVADRLHGTPRVMVLITAWSRAGVAVWYVVQPLIVGIWQDPDLYQKTDYIYRAFGFAAFAGLIALSIAARVWTKPSGLTALALLGLVAELGGSWVPYLGPWISEHAYGAGLLPKLYWLVREGALIVGTIALVHGALAGAPDALAEPRRAMFGFRLAGRALLARVLASVALALLGIGMLKSPGSVKLMMVIAPVIAMASSLAFSIGLLSVERANLAGVPRVRLLIGITTLTWALGIDAFSLGDLARGELAASWTIAAPLIALGGMALVVSAIHGFAASKDNPQLRAMVAGRATLYFTLMVVSVVMPLMIGGLMRTPSSLVVLAVLAAACGIIALVSLAGMMSLMADALSGAPQLPQARLRR